MLFFLKLQNFNLLVLEYMSGGDLESKVEAMGKFEEGAAKYVPAN